MARKVTFDDIFTLLVKNNLLVESSFKKSEYPKTIEYITYNSKDITDSVIDSKNIKKTKLEVPIPSKTLFFCKGNGFKKEYLDAVINSGVKFYVSEKKYEINSKNEDEVEYFIVNDIRTAMAETASFFYGTPKDKLNITGITGTKGKTTVVCFLSEILNKNKKRSTAMLSSIEVYTGKLQRKPSLFSTPEAFELHRHFYDAVANGCDNLVMEVSSQGYKTNRVHNVHFKYGLFLNISEDHISPIEHSDFNDYLSCKLKIFKNCDIAVINRDIDFFDVVYDAAKKSTSGRVILFGSEKYKDEADYYYSNIKEGTKFNTFLLTSTSKILKNQRSLDFKIKMPGLFNIENAVAAVSVALDMGIKYEVIQTAVYNTKAPGRMDIYEKNGITVVVDYAHNLLSFQKLFETLKSSYAGRKIISVGGVVGGKCYNRRKEFASEVMENSDFVYLTADDPQYESVEDICKDVLTYVKEKNRQNYEIITDRKTAVEKAITTATSGDVVVLLSKGVETTQKINGKTELYDGDMNVAKKALLKQKEFI